MFWIEILVIILLPPSCCSGSSPFRFFNSWINHEDCIPLITKVWSSIVSGTPIFKFIQKLKLVKAALKGWSKHLTGKHTFKLRQELMVLQKELDSYFQNEKIHKLHKDKKSELFLKLRNSLLNGDLKLTGFS